MLALYGHSTNNQLAMALADFGLIINLMNMMPIGMMDGGRVLDACSPWFGVMGSACGAYLCLSGYFVNPLIYMGVFMGAIHSGGRLLGNDEYAEDNPEYRNISSQQQLQIMALYAAIVVALLTAMRKNNEKKLTPRQMRELAALRESESVHNEQVAIETILAKDTNSDGTKGFDEFDFEAYFGVKDNQKLVEKERPKPPL